MQKGEYRKMPEANYGITQYKSKSHNKINDYLRKIKDANPRLTPADLSPADHSNMVTILDDIDSEMYLNTAMTHPILYRGCGFLDFGITGVDIRDFPRLKKKEGKRQRRWEYTSTSFTKYKAEKFAKTILIEIHPSPQAMLNDLTRYTNLKNSSTEDEVLLARGTWLKIIKVEQKKNRFQKMYIHVTAEV